MMSWMWIDLIKGVRAVLIFGLMTNAPKKASCCRDLAAPNGEINLHMSAQFFEPDELHTCLRYQAIPCALFWDGQVILSKVQ